MYPAASEARKTTVAASSSGRPNRPAEDAAESLLDVVGRVLVGHLRGEKARGHSGDADALATGPLRGEIAGEADEGGFARGVGGLGQAGGRQPDDAGDVDDRRAGLHDPAAGLGEPVGAVEVDVDDLAELLGGFLRRRHCRADSRVVDENVDLPEGRHGLRDHTVGVLGIGDVGADRDGSAAQRLDLRLGFGEFVLAAGREDYVGAGFGERDGERHPQPRRGTGDDSDFAVELEHVEYTHW